MLHHARMVKLFSVEFRTLLVLVGLVVLVWWWLMLVLGKSKLVMSMEMMGDRIRGM